MKTAIIQIVEKELTNIKNPALFVSILRLLVPPSIVLREWEYGLKGQKFPCWTIAKHPPSNTEIAYCEFGFGPSRPWGLVFSSGKNMQMGQRHSWFSTLEEAMKASCAWGQSLTSYDPLLST